MSSETESIRVGSESNRVEVLEVRSEVVKVQNINTSAITSLLPKKVRSQALTKISTISPKVGSTSKSIPPAFHISFRAVPSFNTERSAMFRVLMRKLPDHSEFPTKTRRDSQYYVIKVLGQVAKNETPASPAQAKNSKISDTETISN